MRRSLSLSHVLVGEPASTPYRVRGRLSPEHALSHGEVIGTRGVVNGFARSLLRLEDASGRPRRHLSRRGRTVFGRPPARAASPPIGSPAGGFEFATGPRRAARGPAHVPAKACSARDAGWTPGRRQEHAPIKA